MSKPSWIYPWSIKPIDGGKYESFDQVPFLDETVARAILLLGIAALVSAALTMLTKPASPKGFTSLLLEPWAKAYLAGEDDLMLWAILSALIPTSLICTKQWQHYYWVYGEGKQGMFKKSIRYVNYLEKIADYALAIVGVLLFTFAVLPITWFLVLSIYSLLVIFRCVITLMRPRFASRLQKRGVNVKPWYYESLGKEHNGLKIRTVLVGWILTDVIIALYSIVVFWLFWSYYPWHPDPIIRLLVYGGSLAGVIGLYYYARNLTYPLSKKICEK